MYTEEWYKEYQNRQAQYKNKSTANLQKETKVDKCNVAKTKSKYGAIKCEMDGHVFDSKAEAQRYSELKLMQQAGKISDLQLQPRYILQDNFKKHGQAYRKIEYVADFSYMENGNYIIEDVKGIKTEVFKIKQKIFEYKYPELELKIIGGNK